jgi:hypothetical protein
MSSLFFIRLDFRGSHSSGKSPASEEGEPLLESLHFRDPEHAARGVFGAHCHQFSANGALERFGHQTDLKISD